MNTRRLLYRVVCPEFTGRHLSTLEAAQDRLRRISVLGSCELPHHIEVFDGRQWLPLDVYQARQGQE